VLFQSFEDELGVNVFLEFVFSSFKNSVDGLVVFASFFADATADGVHQTHLDFEVGGKL